MTIKGKPPRLFPWGIDGIPGEIRSEICSAGMIDRNETENDGTNANGDVVAFANGMLARLLGEKRAWADSKGRAPKLSYEIACWVYLLHAYCSREGMPAPPELLWLTFEALGLKEGAPDLAIVKRIGTADVNKVEEFLLASLLDGEADAAGKSLSLSDLARQTGISRQTLRRWREMKQYRSRRDFTAWTCGKSFPDHGWAEAIERANRRLREDGHGGV